MPFLFLGCLLLACQSSPTPDRAATEQPLNVLFILADDLGYHDLGATGSTFYETPNLDRLAASSVVFDQAYAGSRVCSPSRASIMLGQFTATHGITDWIGAPAGEDWRGYDRFTSHLPPPYDRVLPDTALTLAEAFQQDGYSTFFAGKWHLGGEGSLPTDHGFDINVGGNDKGSPAGGYFDPYENPNLPNRRPGENLSMRLARETKDFIVDGNERPFFAYLSFYAVHGPIQTTEENWRHYRNKAVEGGTADQAYEMERRMPIRTVQDNPVYAGLVQQMDEAVGLVLDALDSLGIADNTIVVFTSDNGGVASGDNFSTSNLPLRGGKGYQWEGGTREPLFLRIGDRVTSGTVKKPVIGADLYPTLTALASLGVDPPQAIDGKDLTPLIRGEDWPERSLFWHYPHYGNQGGDPSSVILRGANGSSSTTGKTGTMNCIIWAAERRKNKTSPVPSPIWWTNFAANFSPFWRTATLPTPGPTPPTIRRNSVARRSFTATPYYPAWSGSGWRCLGRIGRQMRIGGAPVCPDREFLLRSNGRNATSLYRLPHASSGCDREHSSRTPITRAALFYPPPALFYPCAARSSCDRAYHRGRLICGLFRR